jgi:hypothetical protein
MSQLQSWCLAQIQTKDVIDLVIYRERYQRDFYADCPLDIHTLTRLSTFGWLVLSDRKIELTDIGRQHKNQMLNMLKNSMIQK